MIDQDRARDWPVYTDPSGPDMELSARAVVEVHASAGLAARHSCSVGRPLPATPMIGLAGCSLSSLRGGSLQDTDPHLLKRLKLLGRPSVSLPAREEGEVQRVSLLSVRHPFPNQICLSKIPPLPPHSEDREHLTWA